MSYRVLPARDAHWRRSNQMGTDAAALWLVTGTPRELANTLQMSEADLAWGYPDGPRALPPELDG